MARPFRPPRSRLPALAYPHPLPLTYFNTNPPTVLPCPSLIDP